MMGPIYPFAASMRYFVPLGIVFGSPTGSSRQQVSLAYSRRDVKSVRTPGGRSLAPTGSPVPSRALPNPGQASPAWDRLGGHPSAAVCPGCWRHRRSTDGEASPFGKALTHEPPQASLCATVRGAFHDRKGLGGGALRFLKGRRDFLAIAPPFGGSAVVCPLALQRWAGADPMCRRPTSWHLGGSPRGNMFDKSPTHDRRISDTVIMAR